MIKLEKSLIDLRDRAAGTVKQYSEYPANIYEYTDGSLLFTYAHEKTLVGIQKTLSVSNFHKAKFLIDEDTKKIIEKVFGKPMFFCTQTYPMRGYCIQYIF